MKGGGAHQSIGSPLIGMTQDGLLSFEPAYADELAAITEWSFGHLQRDKYEHRNEQDEPVEDAGGSVYLRLSTRSLEQPLTGSGEGFRDAVTNPDPAATW